MAGYAVGGSGGGGGGASYGYSNTSSSNTFPAYTTFTYGPATTFTFTSTFGTSTDLGEKNVDLLNIDTAVVKGGTVGQIKSKSGVVVWQSEPFEHIRDENGDIKRNAYDLACEAAGKRREAALAALFEDDEPVVSSAPAAIEAPKRGRGRPRKDAEPAPAPTESLPFEGSASGDDTPPWIGA